MVYVVYVKITAFRHGSNTINEMKDFCYNSFGEGTVNWDYDNYDFSFIFDRAEDATLFRLRWFEYVSTMTNNHQYR